MVKKSARKRATKKPAKKSAAAPSSRVIERPAGKAADLRPVKAGSGRAAVVEMGLKGEPVSAIAAALKKDRQWILTTLFLLNRDCAVGYRVEGDALEIRLPRGRGAEDAVKKQV